MSDRHDHERHASFEDRNAAETSHDEDGLYDNPRWLGETPFWAISALLHAVLFLILIQIAIAQPDRKKPTLPIQIRPIARKPDPYDPTPDREMQKTPRIPDPRVVEKPVIERKPVEIEAKIPKGLPENLTNVMKLESLHDILGVRGGPAGAYGQRLGKGSLVKEGGSKGSEQAVRAALEWLRRHQSADGSWKAHDFTERCTTTCQNASDGHGDGRGFREHDVGVTGLAMLAFTGYGHTHRDGPYPEYVEVLKKAVKFLKRVQVRSSDPNNNGRYGHPDLDVDSEAMPEQWIYDHAIATMAMAELLAMSPNTIGLRRSVTDAIELCLHAQNDGSGWKYGIKPGNNDTSVTGWMVLALKTARSARIRIPRERYTKALDGALRWFERATSVSGKTGYQVPGDEGSRLRVVEDLDGSYPYSKKLSCMTAVAILSRLFAGESRSAPSIKKGVNVLMSELPHWSEPGDAGMSRTNLYYWYYGSYAMFQFGGSLWRKWNDAMQDALLGSQRRGGDEDGSWDPVGEWGRAGGRVYSTAIGAMTLEVYYRFVRTQGGV